MQALWMFAATSLSPRTVATRGDWHCAHLQQRRRGTRFHPRTVCVVNGAVCVVTVEAAEGTHLRQDNDVRQDETHNLKQTAPVNHRPTRVLDFNAMTPGERGANTPPPSSSTPWQLVMQRKGTGSFLKLVKDLRK